MLSLEFGASKCCTRLKLVCEVIRLKNSMLKPLSSKDWDYAKAAHLLNRAGFGGPPAEIQKLADLGLDQAVSLLLDYESIPDPAENPAWAKPDPERMQKIRDMNQHGMPEEKRQFQQEEQRNQRERMMELRGWWLADR